MNAVDQVELYILKCAALKLAVERHTLSSGQAALNEIASEDIVKGFIGQFSAEVLR
jgi:hypothetical protein